MSNDRNQTTFKSGAFVSEHAVRGTLDRRRRSGPTNTAPATGRSQLRRWSVAELIARATPRPPAGGVAH